MTSFGQDVPGKAPFAIYAETRCRLAGASAAGFGREAFVTRLSDMGSDLWTTGARLSKVSTHLPWWTSSHRTPGQGCRAQTAKQFEASRPRNPLPRHHPLLMQLDGMKHCQVIERSPCRPLQSSSRFFLAALTTNSRVENGCTVLMIHPDLALDFCLCLFLDWLHCLLPLLL